MINKNRLLLDCTLRDGGYVNDWDFGEEAVDSILAGLSQCGVDIIECGILGKTNYKAGNCKFNCIEDSFPMISKRQGSALYSCIMNYSEKDKFVIGPHTSQAPDIIRVAFFKPEYKEAIEYSYELKKKGYLVFLQAMATSEYDEQEVRSLIEKTNDIKPDALYLVDSFGTMYPKDILFYTNILNRELDNTIILGFHAHNNMQLAFSNCITFIECCDHRKISVDATLFGMGRGAGNAPTELVAKFFNQQSHHYDVDSMILLIEKWIHPIYEKYNWGYGLNYLLASHASMNPAYIWYLSTKGIKELGLIMNIIQEIPMNKRYSLDKELVDQIILSKI